MFSIKVYSWVLPHSVPQQHMNEVLLLLFPFYWGKEKINHLPKVTELGSSRIGTWTQFFHTQNWLSFLHLPVNQALEGKRSIYNFSQSWLSKTLWETKTCSLSRRGIPEAILKAGEAPGWRALDDHRRLCFVGGFWNIFAVNSKQKLWKLFTIYYSQVFMFQEKPAEKFHSEC